MKNIFEERQKFYRNMLETRFAADVAQLDAVEQRCIGEVIGALAMGCCLQQPRKFAGKLTYAEDFRRIAKTTSFETLCVAVQAVAAAESRSTVRNRIWYIMGTLIQACWSPRPSARNVRGYEEHSYTPEELRSVYTPIESLRIEDL